MQMEYGARTRLPRAIRLRISGPGFVQNAVVLIDDQHMPVAAALRAALNGRVGGDRVRTGVAFVGVLERDGDLCLLARHGDERNADRAAIPQAGAEIGMSRRAGADRSYVLAGVRVDR